MNFVRQSVTATLALALALCSSLCFPAFAHAQDRTSKSSSAPKARELSALFESNGTVVLSKSGQATSVEQLIKTQNLSKEGFTIEAQNMRLNTKVRAINRGGEGMLIILTRLDSRNHPLTGQILTITPGMSAAEIQLRLNSAILSLGALDKTSPSDIEREIEIQNSKIVKHSMCILGYPLIAFTGLFLLGGGTGSNARQTFNWGSAVLPGALLAWAGYGLYTCSASGVYRNNSNPTF